MRFQSFVGDDDDDKNGACDDDGDVVNDDDDNDIDDDDWGNGILAWNFIPIPWVWTFFLSKIK